MFRNRESDQFKIPDEIRKQRMSHMNSTSQLTTLQSIHFLKVTLFRGSDDDSAHFVYCLRGASSALRVDPSSSVPTKFIQKTVGRTHV